MIIANDLGDRFIRHHVDLLRLEASERRIVLKMLKGLENDIVSRLLKTEGLTLAETRKLEALFVATEEMIRTTYKNISTQQRASLIKIGEFESDQTAQIVNRTVGASLMTVGVPLVTIKAMVDGDTVLGLPAKDWWAKQATTLKAAFQDTIRRGVFAGETLNDLLRRIRGTRESGFTDGIMGGATRGARRNAEALIRTSVQSILGAARDETLRANDDVIAGQQWLSTLDPRTCWSTDTNILMADGSQKQAGDIVAGDHVLGGLSGLPCRVLQAAKRTVLSSVVIQYNGNIIGSVTHDHEVLTKAGWQEIGDLCVLPDLSKREVLCRRFLPTATQNPHSRNAQGCGRECLEEVWPTSIKDLGKRSFACCGLYLGKAIHQTTEDGLSAWLQHDSRRGRRSREIEGLSNTSRQEALETVQGGRRVSRTGKSSREEMRTERGRNETSTLCVARREGDTTQEVRVRVVDKYHTSEQETTVTYNQEATQCKYQSPLEEQGLQRTNQHTTRSRTGCSTSEQSRLGEGKSRENVSSDEGEVERSAIPREDEVSNYFCDSIQCQKCGQEEVVGIIDTRTAGSYRGENAIAVGQMAGVTSAYISGAEQAGEVVVVTLSIEGDPTYVAGGIIVHNCEICMALSGQAWDFDGMPIGETTEAFPGPPPRHFNCRCDLVPILKSWEQLAKDAGGNEKLGRKLDRIERKIDPGTQASMDGQVSSDMDFSAWLKTRSVAEQKEILGPGKWELWSKGKIGLTDLVDFRGSPRTLEQLRAVA